MKTKNIKDIINNNISLVDLASRYTKLDSRNKGLSPFTDEKKPSFFAYDNFKNTGKPFFKCFSSGKGGGVIEFYSAIENISKEKAIIELCKIYNLKIPNFENLILEFKVYDDWLTFTQKLLFESDMALNYLFERGLSEKEIKNYGFGLSLKVKEIDTFCQKYKHKKEMLIKLKLLKEDGSLFFKDRIIYPLRNEYFEIIGYSSLSYNGSEPKYLHQRNSDNFIKEEFLYNFDFKKMYDQNIIFLCEGLFDSLSLDRFDVLNCALFGTNLNKKQIKKIESCTKNIVFCLDNDNAGKLATYKHIINLITKDFTILVFDFKETKDVDELINKNFKDKKSRDFKLFVKDNTVTGTKFLLNYHNIDIENYSNIIRFLDIFKKEILINCKKEITRNKVIKELSKELKISENQILEYFGLIKERKEKKEFEIKINFEKSIHIIELKMFSCILKYIKFLDYFDNLTFYDKRIQNWFKILKENVENDVDMFKNIDIKSLPVFKNNFDNFEFFTKRRNLLLINEIEKEENDFNLEQLKYYFNTKKEIIKNFSNFKEINKLIKIVKKTKENEK